jgi:hypothetical protein
MADLLSTNDTGSIPDPKALPEIPDELITPKNKKIIDSRIHPWPSSIMIQHLRHKFKQGE